MSYRIKSGEDRASTKTLSEAKLIAGEWQIERERFVTIFTKTPTPKLWQAILEANGCVRLEVLSCDKNVRDIDRVKYHAERGDRVDALILKYSNRRRNTARRGRGVKEKAVLYVCDGKVKRFRSIMAAAGAEDISRQSMQRRIKLGTNWMFEDDAPKGVLSVSA